MSVVETTKHTNCTKKKLPLAWAWVRLGDVCEIRMGETLIQKELTGDGIPVFSANTSSEPWGYTSHGRLQFDEKSVVVGARGSIGFPRWPNLPQWTATQTTIVLTCSDLEQMTPEWLLRVFQRVDFETMTARQAIPMMTVADLEVLDVPLPPLAEQKRIAPILNEQMVAVERARAAAEAQLEAAKALSAAYLRQVFPQPGQTLPPDWQWVRLGEVCEVKGGKRLPRGHEFARAETQYPYLRVVDFENGTVRLNDLEYLNEATQKEIARYIIRATDVYISIAGSIGIVGTIPVELDGANLTENAARLVIRSTVPIDNEYVSAFLRSPSGQEQIEARTNKVGQPKLALERIATIKLPLPRLAEQKRIVAILKEQMATVEKLRAGLEAQLDEVNALPAAILRRAFNGEL